MLRVGTDCSGIEAPIQALRQLGIPHRHVFSSETDKFCIESIKANYDPEIIYGDITKRDVREVPDIDLYVCGFPCQPYSQVGKRYGLTDSRSNVFFKCVEVIKHKLPRVFILENVKTILTQNKGKTFEIIRVYLEELAALGYTIEWKIFNTKDYGIPQNRERLYIVGKLLEDFEWPSEVPMPDLKGFIDDTDNTYQTIRRKGYEKIPPNGVFINLNFLCTNYFKNCDKWCQCLLKDTALWCVPKHRYANIKEHLRLQGFPENFKQVVSNSRMKWQLGNSMSVCVLVAILRNLV